MGRLWITSWFVVAYILSYGVLSLGCLGFSGFYRKKVFDLLCWWRCRGSNMNIWNLIHPCLMWTIWRERNWCIFENVDCTSSQIKASFISFLYEWSLVLGRTDSNSIHSFIVNSYVDIIPLLFFGLLLVYFHDVFSFPQHTLFIHIPKATSSDVSFVPSIYFLKIKQLYTLCLIFESQSILKSIYKPGSY